MKTPLDLLSSNEQGWAAKTANLLQKHGAKTANELKAAATKPTPPPLERNETTTNHNRSLDVVGGVWESTSIRHLN